MPVFYRQFIRLKPGSAAAVLATLWWAATSAFPAPAIIPRDRADQAWRLSSFAQEAGLNNHNILHFDFEKDGTVWVATSDGLYRYNGFNWRHFTRKDGLPSDSIRCVLVTRTGQLWVGSDQGAGLFDGKTYRTMGSEHGLAGTNVRRMVEDPDGTIWFCCDSWPNARMRGGLTEFSQGAWKVHGVTNGLPSEYVVNYFRDSSGRQYALTLRGPAERRGDQWLPFSGVGSRPDLHWSSAVMVESPTEGVLLSTGHEIFVRQNGAWRRHSPVPFHENGLAVTRDGTVFLCIRNPRGRSVLHQLIDRRTEPVSSVFDLAHGYIEEIREAPDGSIWFAGFNTLRRWAGRGSEWARYDPLPPPALVDSRGRTWLAGSDSIYRQDNNRWDIFEGSTGSMAEDRKGGVWNWRPTDLIHWSDRATNAYSAADAGLTNIHGFTADAQGRVWLDGQDGTGRAQLSIFDGEKWTRRPLPEPTATTVQLSAADPTAGVWYLVSDGGPTNWVVLAGGQKASRIPIAQERLAQFENNLYADRFGNVWIYGGLGLLRWDGNPASDWDAIANLPGRFVFGCAERSNEVWFACHAAQGGTSGLLRWRDETWTQFPADVQGIVGQSVDESILFGGDGRFTLIDDSTGGEPATVIMPTRDVVSGLVKDGEGRFWIGTGAGVYTFKPDRIPPETHIIAAVKAVQKGDPFTIRFQGVNRFVPRTPARSDLIASPFRFSWRIDDGTWSAFTSTIDQTFSTTDMTVGTHKIEARTQDNSMDIDPTPAVLVATIRPIPLQSRAWFWPATAAVFLAITVLAAATWNSKRQIARYAFHLEDKVRERTAALEKDIQHRREVEVALRASEHRLRLSNEIARVGGWELDLERNIFTGSEPIIRLLAGSDTAPPRTREQFLNLVHPLDRPRVDRAIQMSIDSGQPYRAEFRVVRPNGKTGWIESRAEVFRNADGTPVRMVGVSVDITERREAEAERLSMDRQLQETQKLESLGVLAGGIAHDFNNLLTGILGNASLARLDLPADSGLDGYLSHIEESSQRAADLCKQMLAYSGKGRFVVQRINLSTLVQETAHLLNISISKKATLKFHLAQDLPAVFADATQMRQIIMNLVINASEAIGDGGGIISISTAVIQADTDYLHGTHLSPDLPAGDYVSIEISDTGSGMTPETLARIFDPFFTTKFTGRGLGLAAVLGIVRGHKGALKVYSEPGRGSTFKLLLPCADGPVDSGPADRDKHPDAWRGQGLVLVVDDEETVRTVTARMLRSFGFEVVLACDGIEGVECFRERQDQITLVILDLTMPRMDGEEAFRELRGLRPEVPVLLMSGFNEQEAISRFAGKGLAGFMQKPFKAQLLREKIQEILRDTQVNTA